MNSQKYNLKDYSIFLPLLGSYFILYGAVDLLTYYDQFDIPIMQFISFSEIIIYFIKDIYIILISVSSIFLGIKITDYLNKTMNKLENNVNTMQVAVESNIEKADEILGNENANIDEAKELLYKSLKLVKQQKVKLNRIK